jgi:hypothetical protein
VILFQQDFNMKNLKLFFVLSILILLTACALPTGNPRPIVDPPVPASGSVLFQDDFSNSASGWDHVSSPGGAMDYDSGVYRFLVGTPHFNYWSTPGKIYADTRVEVDVAKLEGPDSNRAGLICRLTGEQFYFFVISSDGYYAVGRTNGLESVLLGQDQMMMSANINTGLALNHLRADCAGDRLTFYINGFPVSQVTDATLASGEVGLLAGTFEQGNVDIIFDQFIVLQP